MTAILSFAAFNAAAESLPKGYGGVELGMSLDSAKQALKSKSDFGYAGDRDVSLLPGAGSSFTKKICIQS